MKRTIGNMLGRVGAAKGFTLIELLIGIGAIALIAVGVAAIFDATGKTVKTGKRLSAFNEYAGLIERRLRADIQAMTRDGYLIIRNEYADADGNGSITMPSAPGGATPDAVLLYDGDTRPRLRRTDEIMFFAKGQFTSARELLDPRFVAGADAAAIYYGHGQRARDPGYNQGAPGSYYEPSVDGKISSPMQDPDPEARLGYHTTQAASNPNEFASDWILLRHLTLLRPPQDSQPITGNTGVFNLPANDPAIRDSEVQIALQPASSNLFRALASIFPANPTPQASPTTVRKLFDAGYLHPTLASGLVDIATTELSEIRMIITTADSWPGGGTNPANTSFFDPTANNNTGIGANPGVDGTSHLAEGPNSDTTLIARMQAWMNDGLPAWSMADGTNFNKKHRIRCERVPVNYTGTLSAGYPGNDPELPSRRADQLMLAASNFLPRCTEFIVEWSFGMQYTSDPNNNNYDPAMAGQLVWYGMERYVNQQLKPVANLYLAGGGPAPQGIYPWNQQITAEYERVSGAKATYAVGGSANPSELFHGANLTLQIGDPVTSYFGYTDPTFNPDQAAPTGVVAPDGRLDSPNDSRSPTIPCPWPRFIRITMSLADPNDPSVEQSFQFVFEVPCANATP